MSATLMDLKPYTPQLSLQERDRRWQAVRGKMGAEGIDCLVVWGNTMIVYKPGMGLMGGDNIPAFVLEENMVLGTNIDIHNPRWRTDVGVMLGDTVQVTAKGGRRLVGIPLELPVK
jgi:hypothetical protein